MEISFLPGHGVQRLHQLVSEFNYENGLFRPLNDNAESRQDARGEGRDTPIEVRQPQILQSSHLSRLKTAVAMEPTPHGPLYLHRILRTFQNRLHVF